VKRFWDTAAVQWTEQGHTILLDGKPMRMPSGAPLVVRPARLARAIGEEWQAAGGAKGGQMSFKDTPLTRLAGTALDGVDDAFGGSMALGLGVSVACAAVVALLIFGIAFWIVSHRDAIETIVVSLMGRSDGTVCPNTQELRRRSVRPHRLGTVYALRLCKRGPPSVAISPWQHVTRSSEGDPRASFSFARVASAARIRDRVVFSGPSRGRPVPSIGSRFTR